MKKTDVLGLLGLLETKKSRSLKIAVFKIEYLSYSRINAVCKKEFAGR